MKDKQLQRYLDKFKGVFDSLAKGLKCPSCNKFIKPPFFNLGKKFHWFEGCKDCYERNL